MGEVRLDTAKTARFSASARSPVLSMLSRPRRARFAVAQGARSGDHRPKFIRNRGNVGQNEHVWGTGWADMMQGGITPHAAAEKAFKRIEAIFAKFPIAQA
jgi:hypothetical protein